MTRHDNHDCSSSITPGRSRTREEIVTDGNNILYFQVYYIGDTSPINVYGLLLQVSIRAFVFPSKFCPVVSGHGTFFTNIRFRFSRNRN